ncbi:uncharacterized protein LOC136028273 [Artemia franciscana]|uniref:uncharacterized protein LOC136028273 n=1 Tax=Artemia franciscana TaxID=6661 RepID=UPI0032D9D182
MVACLVSPLNGEKMENVNRIGTNTEFYLNDNVTLAECNPAGPDYCCYPDGRCRGQFGPPLEYLSECKSYGAIDYCTKAISIILIAILGFFVHFIFYSVTEAHQPIVLVPFYLLIIATAAFAATLNRKNFAKNICEVLHQFSIALLYTACGLALLVFLTIELTKSDEEYWLYNMLITAAVFALINGGLHGLSGFYAWRAYKEN